MTPYKEKQKQNPSKRYKIFENKGKARKHGIINKVFKQAGIQNYRIRRDMTTMVWPCKENG
jgi:hypothetical protein